MSLARRSYHNFTPGGQLSRKELQRLAGDTARSDLFFADVPFSHGPTGTLLTLPSGGCCCQDPVESVSTGIWAWFIATRAAAAAGKPTFPYGGGNGMSATAFPPYPPIKLPRYLVFGAYAQAASWDGVHVVANAIPNLDSLSTVTWLLPFRPYTDLRGPAGGAGIVDRYFSNPSLFTDARLGAENTALTKGPRLYQCNAAFFQHSRSFTTSGPPTASDIGVDGALTIPEVSGNGSVIIGPLNFDTALGGAGNGETWSSGNTDPTTNPPNFFSGYPPRGRWPDVLFNVLALGRNIPYVVHVDGCDSTISNAPVAPSFASVPSAWRTTAGGFNWLTQSYIGDLLWTMSVPPISQGANPAGLLCYDFVHAIWLFTVTIPSFADTPYTVIYSNVNPATGNPTDWNITGTNKVWLVRDDTAGVVGGAGNPKPFEPSITITSA